MTPISEKTSLAELGAIVCEALHQAGIDAFLSGGAVVSIYTNNKYESYDLDFVSLADRAKIRRVMLAMGFTQEKSRLFAHPRSKYLVEFPGSAMLVGDALISRFSELKIGSATLKLLTPTDSVKDRLAAFFHWHDRQGLDQAVWICQAQPVDLAEVRSWALGEGMGERFAEFVERLRRERR